MIRPTHSLDDFLHNLRTLPKHLTGPNRLNLQSYQPNPNRPVVESGLDVADWDVNHLVLGQSRLRFESRKSADPTTSLRFRELPLVSNVTVHQHTLPHSWDELFLYTQPWVCVTCLRLFFAHRPDILEFSSFSTGHPLPQLSHHCCFLDCITTSHCISSLRPSSNSAWPPDRENFGGVIVGSTAVAGIS